MHNTSSHCHSRMMFCYYAVCTYCLIISLSAQGKRKMVDGFVRWCAKGTQKIGLSQKLELVEAIDEVPTGLYDGFYVKMPEEATEN